MGWWVADLLEQDPAMLVSWIVWVIGSIILHELAHGWAAIKLGDRTPIETGHMTWNPLVHMGGMSLIMFAIVGIAWGMMPINPARIRGRHGEAIVAAAGPAMNVALAILAMLLGGVWIAFGQSAGEPFYTNVITFFFAGAFLNLILAGLNLLPVPPLDGGRILASFSSTVRMWMMDQQKMMIAMFAVLILVLLPVAVAALNALQIEAVAAPASNMLGMLLAAIDQTRQHRRRERRRADHRIRAGDAARSRPEPFAVGVYPTLAKA